MNNSWDNGGAWDGNQPANNNRTGAWGGNGGWNQGGNNNNGWNDNNASWSSGNDFMGDNPGRNNRGFNNRGFNNGARQVATGRRKRQWWKLILIIFGGIFFIAGFFVWQQHENVRRNGVRVEATIVRLVPRHSNDGTTWAPVFRFFFDGQTFEVTSNSSSSHPPSVGSTRYLYINPNNPHEFTQAGQWFHWIFIGIGGAIALLGVGLLFVGVREKEWVANN
ncbi:MAG: DUF3592 domain-containing protein [Firmicutes bacterium]|nr:DUF3592 domain-containing protein [Bacillota bacterium]